MIDRTAEVSVEPDGPKPDTCGKKFTRIAAMGPRAGAWAENYGARS